MINLVVVIFTWKNSSKLSWVGWPENHYQIAALLWIYVLLTVTLTSTKYDLHLTVFLDTLWYSPISIFLSHDFWLLEAKNSCLMSPRTAVQSPHCLDLYLGTLRTDVHKTRCCSHSFIERVLSHSPAKNYCFSITSLFIGFVALNFVSQYLTIYWIKC